MAELGVPAELQALFNSPNCIFDFGDVTEHFGAGFHKVPTSQNVWRAAGDAVRELIITHSAMEGLAYITFNRHLHKAPENMAFVAIGNYPHALQMDWIRENFRKRKITLVFSNCILGTLADIKVVSGLRKLPVRMRLQENSILLDCNGVRRTFEQDLLSLHVFEKAFAIRSGIRTCKPKNHLTYLYQLIANGK